VSKSPNHESHIAFRHGAITTLIVDDSPRWVKSLSTFLALHPIIQVVGVAGDGLEALEKIESLRPELVLLDIQMPRLGGLEAAPIIRDRFPEVVVVMMTAHPHPELEPRCHASGVRAIIAKSEVRPGLLRTIDTLFPEAQP
jgi:DNA-binding NarL/FixJ family response regulator